MPYYSGVSSFPFFALLFLLLMHHLGSIAVFPASEIFNSSSLHDVLQEPQAAGPVTDTGPQALLRITVEMHTSRAGSLLDQVFIDFGILLQMSSLGQLCLSVQVMMQPVQALLRRLVPESHACCASS